MVNMNMTDKPPLIRITYEREEFDSSDIHQGKGKSNKIPLKLTTPRRKPNLTIQLPKPGSPCVSVTNSPVDTFSKEQISKWSQDDVIKWLYSKNLYRFIPLFEENKVTGKHLVDTKLEFLEFQRYRLTADEREEILAEIYKLLGLNFPKPGSSTHTKLKDVFDREKYRAAIELSRSRETRSSSPSIVLFPSRCISPLKPITRPTLHMQRSRSESGMDMKIRGSHFPGRNLLEEKNGELWKIFKNYAPLTIFCVEFNSYEDIKLRFYHDHDRLVRIKSVQQYCGLETEDVILEINGESLCRRSVSLERVQKLLESSKKTKLVIGRSQENDIEVLDKLQTMQSQLSLAESRWFEMREKLEYMRTHDDWYPTQNKIFTKDLSQVPVIKRDVERMNTDFFDKDDVMKVLAEKMSETKKQKDYLDKLLTVVIDHAPWILSKMEEDIETSIIDTDKEEWC